MNVHSCTVRCRLLHRRQISIPCSLKIVTFGVVYILKLLNIKMVDCCLFRYDQPYWFATKKSCKKDKKIVLKECQIIQ